ncbi:VCBS repeat-containing protein [Defluviimonas sp. WL0050]|uniref:VCBS repeat-containing protein n=1 Tax=Albidovulum litorale TaxID=2984134 RepID=A0ABT2ZJN8_9RHOB|nr:VCBS repeat-containing protein [Defluviimonas sp. WL0050]MCV2871346.1 VCBS repeat-containing protein [Defluviimonas sp. WL0050]
MRLFAAFCYYMAASFAATPAPAQYVGCEGPILKASYTRPTDRYDHGILGDAIEWGGMKVVIDWADGCGLVGPIDIILPQESVYEDFAPRLWDVTGDGQPEIVTVISKVSSGASLEIHGFAGNRFTAIASTPYIGTPHRWLAPVGAADLDGDGRVEIAYVETPHLGKILKIVRLEGDRLVPVAEAKGLTNHRIGDPFIQGRIATCGGSPTILTSNGDWTRIIGTTLADGKLAVRDLGPYRGPKSFDRIAGCR